MRGYSVATAVLALEVDAKWLDNLLSQHRISGVTQERQGVQRRLAPEALYLVAIVDRLNRDFQMPVAASLRVAHDLWSQPRDAGADDAVSVKIGEIRVEVSRADIRARVDAALPEGLEMAPPPRRGRPRNLP